jgi:ribosomal protein L40E
MYKRNLLILSLFLVVIWISTSVHVVEASQVSIQDENLSVTIEVNNQNIIDAQEETTALVINSKEEIHIFLEWNNTYPSDLKITRFEVAFTYLDLTVYTIPYELNILTQPYSTLNYTIFQNLEPYLQQAGVQLVEGAYQIICKISYQIIEEPTSIHELSLPLYIKIGGNLLSSVVGVAATAGTIITGVTVLGAIREIATTIDVANIINNIVNPNRLVDLDSIPKGLEFLKPGDAPKETVKRMYEHASKHWHGKTCPKCNTKWPKKASVCEKCGITLAAAKKLFSEKVVKLTEKAKMPMYKTVGAVGVKVFARVLGADTMMVNCVLKTMLDSGLAKARVSRRFIINKFIVNGSKIIVSAIIFLQISGLKVFGIYYLIFAIILGATISFVVGTLVNKMLKY